MTGIPVLANKSSQSFAEYMSACLKAQARKGSSWPVPPVYVSGVDLGNLGEGEAAPVGGCPLLDTHTPFRDQIETSIVRLRKVLMGPRSRRIFSRTMLGLALPGRKYFLTFTSPLVYLDTWDYEFWQDKCVYRLLSHWSALRKWLKRARARLEYIAVFTKEGNGVIHMVIRLGMKEKSLKHADLDAMWQRLHGGHVWIVRHNPEKHQSLANYVSDQRKCRKLGSEMSWQDEKFKWCRSPRWIPPGYIPEFKELYKQLKTSGLEQWEVQKMINESVQKSYYKGLSQGKGAIYGGS